MVADIPLVSDQQLRNILTFLCRHAVRYSPCALAEEVYLHPRSTLHKAAPEYVVYLQIVRTAKRPYMAGVTAVEPHWLSNLTTPLCRTSPPLVDPSPFYRPDIDCVMAWHDATYSQHDWPLPRVARPLDDEAACAAVFAAALLGVKVLPAFGGLQQLLLAPAATACRPELVGLPRVGEMINALQQKKVMRPAVAAEFASSFQLSIHQHRPSAA